MIKEKLLTRQFFFLQIILPYDANELNYSLLRKIFQMNLRHECDLCFFFFLKIDLYIFEFAALLADIKT